MTIRYLHQTEVNCQFLCTFAEGCWYIFRARQRNGFTKRHWFSLRIQPYTWASHRATWWQVIFIFVLLQNPAWKTEGRKTPAQYLELYLFDFQVHRPSFMSLMCKSGSWVAKWKMDGQLSFISCLSFYLLGNSIWISQWLNCCWKSYYLWFFCWPGGK